MEQLLLSIGAATRPQGRAVVHHWLSAAPDTHAGPRTRVLSAVLTDRLSDLLSTAHRADADADGGHRHGGNVFETRQEVDRGGRAIGYRHVHRRPGAQRRQQGACKHMISKHGDSLRIRSWIAYTVHSSVA